MSYGEVVVPSHFACIDIHRNERTGEEIVFVATLTCCKSGRWITCAEDVKMGLRIIGSSDPGLSSSMITKPMLRLRDDDRESARRVSYAASLREDTERFLFAADPDYCRVRKQHHAGTDRLLRETADSHLFV